MSKGSLLIVSAPSGAGKTTLVKALMQAIPNTCVSVSYTTRAMRPSEQEGVDYNFVSHDEFKSMLEQGVFLEYAQVFGNFYGTSRVWVEEMRTKGVDVILEIDWQGAKQVRTQFIETQSIFILPLSKAILAERLHKRHGDTAQNIQDRMQEAQAQMSHYNEYDYVVFNDRFEEALLDLQAIVRSQRLQWRRTQECQAELIAKLLS